MKPPPNKGVELQIHDLYRSFGHNSVLRGISLTIPAGCIFVIMGSSGSGKSVLLRHMVGLEAPDQGTILFDGVSILDAQAMAQIELAIVFQHGGLLHSLSVGENIGLYLTETLGLPSREVNDRVNQAIEQVGLSVTQDKHKLPADLSGGMKKRVAIARALAINPGILFYDEPTSELDPITAVTIGRQIRQLNQRHGTTSIVVTHDRDLAMGIGDQIAFMTQGTLSRPQSPAELSQTTELAVQDFLQAGTREDYQIDSNPS
jgi:phospholipid/cholesterol/gamma-HCH transport system ATP-binding protein